MWITVSHVWKVNTINISFTIRPVVRDIVTNMKTTVPQFSDLTWKFLQ